MYIDHGEVSIHYEEFGGGQGQDQPVLVLVFGFSMSNQDWVDFGYVDKLRSQFRVIAVEPRGYGSSTCPPEAQAYQLEHMAADVRAVLDCLDIPQAIVWGYSLGAKIVLAMAKSSPERIQGMILGGFEFHSEVDLSNDVVTETLGHGGQAWRDLWKQLFEVPEPMADRLAQADVRALLSLREAEKHWPSLEDAPAEINVPVLLYAGEHCFCRDEMKGMTRLFTGSSYMEKIGANHFQIMPLADWICDPVIKRFANTNIKRGGADG